MVGTAGSPLPHNNVTDSRAHEVASMYGLTPKVEAAICRFIRQTKLIFWKDYLQKICAFWSAS